MEQIDQLISARWVLPIAPQNHILEDHSIAIRGDRIIAILPTNKAKQQYQAKTTLNLNDHALMPGLINAHTHSPMTLFRGLADDLPLMDWLNNHIWPAENDIIHADSIRDGMRLAIAEMLRGGTTCFNEMYFFPNESAEIAIEENIRACIGHTIMNVPTGWAKDENDYIAKARAAYHNRPQSPLVTWSIAPHAPYTNSDNSLMMAKELADEFNFVINMHLHETQDELNIDLNNHGKRPLQRLHNLKILSKRFIGVHMVHLNDQDIAIANETGMHVVHCPESNLKLASGFAPTAKLLAANVNVAIGTDGAASNNDLDMFSELRMATFLAKATTQNPTAIPAPQALAMATINGAKALGIDHETGSLEPGKAADMIAINLGSFLTQPVYNPISHLAYAVNRLQVSDVWVAGKQLLQNGEFTQLDIARTVANAQRWAKQAEQYKSAASSVEALAS